MPSVQQADTRIVKAAVFPTGTEVAYDGGKTEPQYQRESSRRELMAKPLWRGQLFVHQIDGGLKYQDLVRVPLNTFKLNGEDHPAIKKHAAYRTEVNSLCPGRRCRRPGLEPCPLRLSNPCEWDNLKLALDDLRDFAVKRKVGALLGPQLPERLDGRARCCDHQPFR